MASPDTSTLVFELVALAPDVVGVNAEELEDTINKLPGAAEAERDKTEAECKRLKRLLFAAKAGGPVQANETSTQGLEMMKRETNALTMKLVTLGNKYTAANAEDLRELVKQLPRAMKAERAPAEAEIKRLQAAIAALKATEAAQPFDASSKGTPLEVTAGAVTLEVGAYRTKDAAQAQQHVEAKRVERTAHAAATTPSQRQQTESERRRTSEVLQTTSFPEGRQPPSGPSAFRNTSHRRSHDLYPPLGFASGARQPATSSRHAPRRQSISKLDVDRFSETPSIGDRQEARASRSAACDRDRDQDHDHETRRKRQASSPQAVAVPPPSIKRQRTLTTSLECKLMCGRCKHYRLECNGQPRCQQCHGLCVYHPCSEDDACDDRKCTMIHPSQYSTEEGQSYKVRGINIHTHAPDSMIARMGRQQ
ncbi:hypothetical protein LTR36_006289 [Oleoguttula mirabilis]|uniref:Uncharacterized protein n=1 Tax=Oleoguttula mirabilis TaxID=1507867 RepID=A0AAV9JC34_9PEZI|nr:hypothetical protein LTR36_006289 [Oleoguttula mirabilis]